MNPGAELDRAVCKIVRIKPCGSRDSGHWEILPNATGTDLEFSTTTNGNVPIWHPCMVDVFPTVSTSLGECEPVLDWLYQETIDLTYRFSEDRFVCDDYELPCGQSIQHAACLAVLAISKERKT